jgi:hypothetical protein
MCSQSRVARRQALERCSRWPYGEERGFSSNLSAAPQHWNRQFWQQEDVYPFVEYLLELTDGVTGRIIDVLRRTAAHAQTLRPRSVSLEALQNIGARLPAIISQRA